MTRFFLLAVVVLQLVAVSLQQEDEALNIKIRVGESSFAGINEQINRELRAMYLYEALYAYFDRPAVGLPGFSEYFKKSADEEREHAYKFIHYLNKRGGQVQLKQIEPDAAFEWSSPLEAAKKALDAEKSITVALYALRDQADAEKDYQLVDFIESDYLTHQVEGIAELRELIAKLQRVGSGLGEYTVDKDVK